MLRNMLDVFYLERIREKSFSKELINILIDSCFEHPYAKKNKKVAIEATSNSNNGIEF